MSLQPINRELVTKISNTNMEITKLLQILQHRQFDRKESSLMYQLESDMKSYAKHSPIEFRYFRQQWEEMMGQGGMSDDGGSFPVIKGN